MAAFGFANGQKYPSLDNKSALCLIIKDFSKTVRWLQGYTATSRVSLNYAYFVACEPIKDICG